MQVLSSTASEIVDIGPSKWVSIENPPGQVRSTSATFLAFKFAGEALTLGSSFGVVPFDVFGRTAWHTVM